MEKEEFVVYWDIELKWGDYGWEGVDREYSREEAVKTVKEYEQNSAGRYRTRMVKRIEKKPWFQSDPWCEANAKALDQPLDN